MFRVNTANSVKRPITVYFPQDGDNYTKAIFTAELRRIPQSELEELLSEPDSALIDRVLVSVEGVGDEGGEQLPADLALEAVKADTCAVSAIAAEYLEMTKGRSLRQGKKRA